MDWILTLEYLKVLTSAQIMAAVVILGLACHFRKEIKGLISRIASITLGGAAFEIAQYQRPTDESKQPTGQTNLTGGEPPPAIPALLDQEKIKEALQAERARAAFWEYRYLGYFLVRNTQAALDWLASLQAKATLHLFDTVSHSFPPKEREAILEALELHRLIAIDHSSGLIEVTPKGREYLQWRGPLPQLPIGPPN